MKKAFAVLMAFIILIGTNVCTAAEDGRVILAIGDSISAGYGLDDRAAECFVYLMAEDGDTVINKAVDGNEAVHIISQLTDCDNDNYISKDVIEKTDIVTVTCGGNDMMELLYEKVAAEYPNHHPRGKKITADQVLGQLAAGDLYAINAALEVLDKESDAYYMKDGDFEARLDSFSENLLWITDYIKSINPDVKIVVATQYNPYVEFEHVKNFDVLYSGIEEGVTRLNEAICENKAEGSYTVADVKSAFDGYSGEADLYNATTDFSNPNLDFHPTKDGHVLIAEVFGEIIRKNHYLGVENEDNSYSLPDNVVGYYIKAADGSVRLVDAGIYEKAEGDRVEAVCINTTLVEGAQVKMKDSGLRFVAMVDRSCFDAAGYGLVISCEDSDERIFVDAKHWQNEDCFTVAIENIAKENYSRNYTATPFVKVAYDNGYERVIVGTQAVTRSIYTVAKGLLDKGGLDEAVKAALEEYVKNME